MGDSRAWVERVAEFGRSAGVHGYAAFLPLLRSTAPRAYRQAMRCVDRGGEAICSEGIRIGLVCATCYDTFRLAEGLAVG